MLITRLSRTMLIPAVVASLLICILVAFSAPAWLAVPVVLLAAMGQIWWLHRQIVVPVESMIDTVNQLRKSSLSEPDEIVRPDELGALARVLQDVARTLADRVSALERRDVEHAQAEQLLQAVLRTMSEGVVAIDSEQRILFTNDAARPLLDFEVHDVLGRQLWEVSRSPRIQELVRSVLETREQRRTEIDLPRSRSVVSATATALPQEPIPGAVLMLQNVTELRRLEKLRQDFVSNVSHELKTPLTAIQAYADTLLDGALDDPLRSREFLERIVEQSERLFELILDLLRLAKIESQPEAFDLRPVNLRDAAGDCLVEHAPIAQASEIELMGEGAEEPIWVQADSHELRTVLDNLVENAINYTPAGGRVVVRWSRNGAFARLQVEDTGVGIAKDQQARIFERFYRADRARNRSCGGTGLGLAIVLHLVQLFGGSVDIASELGKGSTFTITLRIADAAHREHSQAVALV